MNFLVLLFASLVALITATPLSFRYLPPQQTTTSARNTFTSHSAPSSSYSSYAAAPAAASSNTFHSNYVVPMARYTATVLPSSKYLPPAVAAVPSYNSDDFSGYSSYTGEPQRTPYAANAAGSAGHVRQKASNGYETNAGQHASYSVHAGYSVGHGSETSGYSNSHGAHSASTDTYNPYSASATKYTARGATSRADGINRDRHHIASSPVQASAAIHSGYAAGSGHASRSSARFTPALGHTTRNGYAYTAPRAPASSGHATFDGRSGYSSHSGVRSGHSTAATGYHYQNPVSRRGKSAKKATAYPSSQRTFVGGNAGYTNSHSVHAESSGYNGRSGYAYSAPASSRHYSTPTVQRIPTYSHHFSSSSGSNKAHSSQFNTYSAPEIATVNVGQHFSVGTRPEVDTKYAANGGYLYRLRR